MKKLVLASVLLLVVVIILRQASAALAGSSICLKSSNGKFVSADMDLNPKGTLVADRDSAREWETFEMVAAADGLFALKALANGKYLSVSAADNSLIAASDSIGKTEKFEILKTKDGKVAIKPKDKSTYVRIDPARANRLFADSKVIGDQSKFSMMDRAEIEADRLRRFNKAIRKYSSQKIVWLDTGEEYRFKLKEGSERTIHLVSVKEFRDSVINCMRCAEVDVNINGRPLHLICEPYTMPTETDGIRIQADTTSGWGNIPKKVQFSLWDARDPIVNTDTFEFPINDYLLFSHEMQSNDEVGHCGMPLDGDPAGWRGYHDYGVDLLGFLGAQDVVSPVDGRIIHIWPARTAEGSVDFVDEDGLSWCLVHMDSIMPYIKVGETLKKGQKVGTLGQSGSTEGSPGLHIGAYLCEGDLKVDNRLRSLNLYPWLVSAYQAKYHRKLFAVARPHHVVSTGEAVLFDGTKSMAFGSKIVSYKWISHDGEVMNNAGAVKVYDKPGTYVATLWIEDEKGNKDVDFCKVKVFSRDNQEKNIPIIIICYTPVLGVQAGTSVRFQCLLFGAPKKPLVLDFGDGTVINDYMSHSFIEHAFKEPGIHIVTAHTEVNGMPVTQKAKVIVGSR